MKRILPVLSGLLFLIVPAAVQAQYTYTTNADGLTLTITAYAGSGGAVSIPGTNDEMTITGIGLMAFKNKGLTSVVIPETITSIGANAFGLNGLTSVTIPASVTNIGNSPFFRCTNLTAINVEAGNPDYTNVNGGLISQNQNTLIEYPQGGIGGIYTVPGDVTSIGTNAFAYCSNLTSIAFSETFTNIAEGAFTECFGLTSIALPASLSGLGIGAFTLCSNLTNVCFAGNASANFSSAAFEEVPLPNILFVSGATGWGSTYGDVPLDLGGIPTFPCSQCGDPALYGDLQVTISPPQVGSGAEWQINGGPGQPSGATTNLSTATYTLSFTPVVGWTTPGNQSITITDGVLTSAIGVYSTNAPAKTGSLEVTITPPGAISNGATWEVLGGSPQSSGATVSNLAVGSNTVLFTSVPGWIAPANQSVAITKGATTYITNVYIAIGGSGASNTPVGAVSVTLLPVGAVSEGASWQVDGGADQTNGATVTNLIAGLHTVSFTSIFGWNTPVTQNVTVISNAVTNVTGIYTMIGTASSGGALSVALLPIGLAGAGWQVDGGPIESSGAVVTNLSPGSHIVSFTNVSGWLTPPEQTNVIITSGVTTLTSGIYTQTNAGLVLLTNGFGTVKHTAAAPVAGSPYKVTAVPNSKNLFAGWVGGTNQPFQSLTNTAVYTFTMEPSLVLEANFVTNIFLAAAGTYRGLFAPAQSTDRAQTNSGSFLFTVTGTGAVSGSLALGSQTVKFSGGFGIDGAASLTPKSPSGWNVVLQLDFAAQTVSGTVSDSAFTAELDGFRDVKATGFGGSYTWLIPGTSEPGNGPYGSSYGTVKVTSSGTITMAGSLADGTAISQSSVISPDGYWPLYVNLYGGKGSLLGWNYFSTNSQTLASAPWLSWINATNSSKTAVYRSGFTNQQAVLTGGIYSTTNTLPPGLTVTLQETNPPFTIAVSNLAGNTNELTMKTNKTTGVISGSFAYPGSKKATVKFNGVILQNQTNAEGYFLGTNQSGTFNLGPP